jgi:Ca2+-binding RTX toxin-like protein
MASRRILQGVTMSAATLILAAAPAGAAEIVGSDLTRTPDSAPAIDTIRVQTTAPTGVLIPAAASTAGVITKLRLKHGTSGADPGLHTFRIVSGTAPNYAMRSHVRLSDFTAPSNAVAGELVFIPKDDANNPQGVPIAAGERVAIGRVNGTNGQGLLFTDTNESAGALRHFRNGIPASSDNSLAWSPAADQEIMLQYTVEADTDGDGYGDETQDACVGGFKAGNQPGCVPDSCKGLVVTHLGTNGPDSITGTPGNDVIDGLGGNDVILGLGGNDILCGGDGNDALKGAGGKDTLLGELGNDKLNGGGGAKDVCKGGPGKKDKARKCEKVRKVP